MAEEKRRELGSNSTETDVLIADVAVRDLTTRNSDPSKHVDGAEKLVLYVHNGLNQQVTITPQVSIDGGTTWRTVGAAYNIAAATTDIRDAEAALRTRRGRVRVTYVNTVIPTSGTIYAELQRRYS